MDGIHKKRRVCETCKRELAHAAFFCHLKDRTGVVCPAKQQVISYTDSHYSDLESKEGGSELDVTATWTQLSILELKVTPAATQ